MNESRILTLFNQANGTNLNNESRKQATEKLMEMQNMSGYPSTLLKVWQSSEPDTLREIALVQFKNHAVNNFKRNGNNEEKEHCKRLLLNTYLNEKSEQICKQISQCIAKLSRREWPSNWSQLFVILVNNIKKDDANSVLRTALIIKDILHEINSMRLPLHRAETDKLCVDLMPILFEIWTKAFAFTFSQFETKAHCDLNKLYKCLKLCLLLSQSIKILLHKSSNLDFSPRSVSGEYMNKTLDVIQKLHDQYYVQLISLKDVIECVNNILKTLLKTVRDCHLDFTLQFRLILPSYLSYYTHLIVRNKTKYILNEVMVYALLFIYDVCKQPQYQGKDVSGIQFTPSHKIVFNQSDANECKLIITNFFTSDRLKNIIQCLIKDLFVLTRKDLEDRCIDPCSKWQQQHIEHNNDNIRAAAKQLFRILIKRYCSICAPIIVEMFKSITDESITNNINYKSMDPENAMHRHFFLKEAIYLAIGLKYWNIAPYLAQFGCKFNVIGEILSADLKLYGHDSGYKIPFLSARILWLFGELKDDINKNCDTKQYVYNAILTHLEPSSNSESQDEVLLLRLNAAEALYNLLDDTGFEVKEYSHLLQRTFSLLLKLVFDCDGSLECQQDILRYISVTIKQNASTLSNYNDNDIVNSIFGAMGICWDNCNTTETNLCRVNLIECITHLIKCMKSVNVHKLYNKLIPMISYCTESTDDDSRICLIDQGLELWFNVLYHSYKLENEMNVLFSKNWVPQMKTNADFFDILMSILKSYLFLGGATFVQNHAEDIGNTLSFVVTDVVFTGLDESFSKITDVLCVFIQLFPTQSPQFLFSLIQYLVKQFVEKINKCSVLRCECYMLFFSRLLLVNCDGTLKVLESIQQKQNNNNLIQTLFECMFTAKNKVKQFYKQKIVVLGLLKIFCGVTANDNSLLLPLLTQLLPWFLHVIKDTEIDCLEFAEDMHPEMEEGNTMEWTEADRMSNLYCNDIVSHTFMIDVVLKTLNQSAQKLNISMQNLLKQIADNQESTNNSVIADCKCCSDKYNKYLKTKND